MRMLRTALALSSVLALGLTACSTSSSTTTSAPATGTETSAAATESASSAPVNTDDLTADITKGDGTKTIYLVSKGFQHCFW